MSTRRQSVDPGNYIVHCGFDRILLFAEDDCLSDMHMFGSRKADSP
jgi:hypothetical protein